MLFKQLTHKLKFPTTKLMHGVKTSMISLASHLSCLSNHAVKPNLPGAYAFNHFRTVEYKSCGSTGLPTKPFIPAFRQAFLSSSKTLAVMARIGIFAWSLFVPGRDLIWRVASNPSIFGICISINTSLYALSRTIDTAS